MEKKRSVGVIIFSILYILVGLLFILMMPLFSIFYLITGIGVFLLKAFARYLAITVSLFGIIISIISAVGLLQRNLQQTPALRIVIAVILTCLFHLSAIYFFTRPKVKEQFK